MKERILNNFLSLTRIPRKSHHEEKVSRFLYDWALEKGLTACRDRVGNVIIDKPGDPGYENAPRTILQAHMDMVCVGEPGREYDPINDPITVINDGKTLTADGTSLGGDDGAGVAIAMTILEDHGTGYGPLRAIFTVDEEDGMLGADSLDKEYLDAEYLINLDWEEFGSLCCSSAGSDMYTLSRPARWGTAEGRAFVLDIRGLEGGHSGAQIHLHRANAIRMAARILRTGENACGTLMLATFKGGSAHNAIPSSAAATVVLDNKKASLFLEAVRTAIDEEKERCALTDPNASITISETDLPDKALSADQSSDALSILTEIHDGVNTMSSAIPGLVESSANTGLAELGTDTFSLTVHQRSSEPAITAEMKKDFTALSEKYGYMMETLASAPAWPVKADSELMKICCRKYHALTGKEISVEPVHAGLECGSFSAKNPGLDIISIGPTILDIHSPRETLMLDSVYSCDILVREILKEIAVK